MVLRRLSHIDSRQARLLEDKAIGILLNKPPNPFNWAKLGFGYALPTLFDEHSTRAFHIRFASDIHRSDKALAPCLRVGW